MNFSLKQAKYTNNHQLFTGGPNPPTPTVLSVDSVHAAEHAEQIKKYIQLLFYIYNLSSYNIILQTRGNNTYGICREIVTVWCAATPVSGIPCDLRLLTGKVLNSTYYFEDSGFFITDVVFSSFWKLFHHFENFFITASTKVGISSRCTVTKKPTEGQKRKRGVKPLKRTVRNEAAAFSSRSDFQHELCECWKWEKKFLWDGKVETQIN